MSATEPSRRITFRYLSEPDMIAAGVTDMAACVDVMDDVFKLLGVGDYRLAGTKNNSHGAWLMFPDAPEFPGMPANGPDRRFMAMPAYLGGKYRETGVKWYGSNVENRRAGQPRSILVFVLNDTDTGAPKAIMSANLLSAVRTGAVPGLGARYFARPDAKTIGIVGPGVMNRTSLDGFMSVCPGVESINLMGRSTATIDSFRDRVARRYPSITSVNVVDSIEAAVQDADIVSIAMTAPEAPGAQNYPLLKREWIKPGAYLSLPADVRIDDALCADDVLKVVDSRSQYEAWGEEFPAPHHDHVGIIGTYFIDLIESGAMDADAIVDLGSIATGDRAGRQTDDQIVLFSIGGLPVEDVAWASTVYQNAMAKDIGTELLLWDAPELA